MAHMDSQGGFNSLPPALCGDTLIDCSRNHKTYPDGVPIRLLTADGDTSTFFVVPTLNEMTGEVVYRMANSYLIGQSPCISLTVCRPSIKASDETDGVEYRKIVCTPYQGFLLSTEHQYKPAKELQYGDRLQVARASSYIFKPDGKYRTRQRTECRVSIGVGWTGKSIIKYEHRLIAEAIYGHLPDGLHVHHIDEERLNNEPANLKILSPEEHRAEHADENKRPTFYTGRITPDSDAKWRDRNWLASQLKRKTVIEIAADCNISFETIERWCRKFDLSPTFLLNKKQAESRNLKSAGGKRKAEIRTLSDSIAGRPRSGAWTVLGSEPYQDGQPVDVYGIVVKVQDYLYHNFQVEGLVVQSHILR